MRVEYAVKLIERSATELLAAAQVVCDGLSSAREIQGLVPSAHYLGLAALCASVVEIQIYQQNAQEGLTRLPLLVGEREFLTHLLIQRVETYRTTVAQRKKELWMRLEGFLNELLGQDESRQQIEKEDVKLPEEFRDFFRELYDARAKSFLDGEGDGPLPARQIIQKLETLVSCPSFLPSTWSTENIRALSQDLEKLHRKQARIGGPFLRSYTANQVLLKQATASGEAVRAREAKEQLAILQGMLTYNVLCSKLRQEELGRTASALVACSELCPTERPTADISPEFLDKLRRETSSTGRKLWSLRLGMLFSLACAVATGAVSFYTFPGVLVGMVSTVFHCALSSLVLSAIIWPLTIIVAIAYGMLIYNTVADLVIHETMSQWWWKLSKKTEQRYGKAHGLRYYALMAWNAFSWSFCKLAAWFIPRTEERWYAYLLRIVLSLAVVAFGVLSSLATGYTVFFQLHGFVSLAVCAITALPIGLGNLLFTLKNSYDSLVLLCEMSCERLCAIFSPLWRMLVQQMQRESTLQRVLCVVRLPLLIVLILAKVLIFLAHVIFTAASADKFFTWPGWLMIAISAGSELLTDICPLFGGESEAEHEHGGILNGMVKLLLFVPVTLLAALNWLLSQFNRFTTSHRCLTLREAVFQEWELFGIWHKHAASDQSITIDLNQTKLPLQTTCQRAILMCNEQINRLQSGLFMTQAKEEKIQVFKKCVRGLWVLAKSSSGPTASESVVDFPIPGIAQRDLDKLSAHRHRCSTFFRSSKSTESARRCYEMMKFVSDRGVVAVGGC